MTLRERQSLFLQNIALLIGWAFANGYELTGGELYRTPEQAEIYAKTGMGITKSLHRQRLAVDLNLFKNGIFYTDTESHKPLGDYWKSLHPDNRWGGDFKNRPDGNHYKMKEG